MIELLVAADVILDNLVFADPADLLPLLVALGAARGLVSHKENLTKLHRTELAPDHIFHDKALNFSSYLMRVMLTGSSFYGTAFRLQRTRHQLRPYCRPRISLEGRMS